MSDALIGIFGVLGIILFPLLLGLLADGAPKRLFRWLWRGTGWLWRGTGDLFSRRAAATKRAASFSLFGGAAAMVGLCLYAFISSDYRFPSLEKGWNCIDGEIPQIYDDGSYGAECVEYVRWFETPFFGLGVIAIIAAVGVAYIILRDIFRADSTGAKE